MRLMYAPVTAVLLLVSFWCGSLAPSSTTILGPAASCCGAAAGAGSRVAAACIQTDVQLNNWRTLGAEELAMVHVAQLSHVLHMFRRIPRLSGSLGAANSDAAFNLPSLTDLLCYLWPDRSNKPQTPFSLWAGGIHTVVRQQKHRQ
jgi:hypothetical protein